MVKHPEREERVCNYCGESYRAMKQHKYCSLSCGQLYRKAKKNKGIEVGDIETRNPKFKNKFLTLLK